MPTADTFHTVSGAPVDRNAESSGRIAVFRSKATAYASPGGQPVATIPAYEIGSVTALPVVRSEGGWLLVRLPSRPNGVMAWVPASSATLSSTSWRVVINTAARTMTIHHGGTVVGSWSVGVGAPGTPTPTGQTFVMSGFQDPRQLAMTPVLFALGEHSDTYDSFGGGPGTVAIHGWPNAAGRHGAVSHGCVRVPSAALEAMYAVPNGSPVVIG